MAMIHDYVGRLSGTPKECSETSDEERINDSEVGLHFMEASRSDSEPDWMECCEFMTAAEIRVKLDEASLPGNQWSIRHQ